MEIKAQSARQVAASLLGWYRANGRDLPWRRTRDPYAIWVSEVMLQQTRVAAVQERYSGFLERFPTVERLAAARQATVLAAWSGLGYYRRARNLHQAAKEVVREHGGELPKTAEHLRRLPGIGRYTAAAIASIAFGEVAAVVDGNVERVLRRVSGDHQMSGERLWAAAASLLDGGSPADSNQAMMELGATVCLPKAPACARCPLVAWCATRGEHWTAAARPSLRQRVAYAYARRNGSVLLTQRPASARLMPGMWELPQARPGRRKPLLELTHSITNTRYEVAVVSTSGARSGGEWMAVARLGRLPLTGLARKIFRRLELL